MNPLVERYASTDLPLRSIVQDAEAPRGPLVQALLYIEDCLEGKRLARDAIRAAQVVPVRGADPELLILMLSRWAELSCRIRRPSDARTLVHRVKALLTETTHPEIRAVAMRAESILADAMGNKAGREEVMKAILSSLPPSSPRRKFHLCDLALFLAQQGRATEWREEIRVLADQCNDQFPRDRVRLVEFVNLVETGHAADALAVLEQMNPNDNALSRDLRTHPAADYRRLAEMIRDEQAPGRTNGTPPAPSLPSWMRVIEALLQGDTDTALRVARIEAGKVMEAIFAAGFGSFNLIRAELASGTPESAKRLLNMRQARGNRQYMDDFFYARAEWLAGNRNAAVDHFAELLHAVEEHGAEPRLDFEMRLARELSPGDVVELTRSAGKQPRRVRAAPAPTQPPEPEDEGIESPHRVEHILGQSQTMQDIRRTVVRFAEIDAPVLITGETGVGKDVVARALHEAGKRRAEPFTPVNCASITETLLESELFGHERGAFTGAEKAKKGLFDETGKGTILLDEIGDISPRLQTTLLRVLETGEIRAVGSARTRKTSCRILAATNADLNRLADSGLFRKDLLFRLQRLGLFIPPLRERREDILLLAHRFLDEGRSKSSHATLSPGLSEVIQSYDWPGNVRELRNVIERMRLMHSDKLAYDVTDLDLKFQSFGSFRASVAKAPPVDADGAERAAPGESEPPADNTGADARATREATANIEALLRNGTSRIRRCDRLRELFSTYGKLTRSEAIKILGVSPNTATQYLKALCAEGFIQRVEPTASTRSHYFKLKPGKRPDAQKG